MPTKIVMPQLGESVVEGTINKWLKQVGDSVTEYEPLLEISTDKVDTEVPAPASGILLQILVPAGQTVERGVLLALIGDPNEVEAPHPTTHPEIVSTNGIESVSVANRISPVVARMAAEHRIDLNQISGTGLGGRVTKKDVDTYLAQPPAATPKTSDLPPWEQPVEGDLFKPTGEIFAKARQSLTPTLAPTPAPATSQMPVGKVGTRAMPPTAQNIAPITTAAPSDNGANGGAANGDEVMPLSPMRRAIAEHMVRSKLDTSPHVTTVFEVDMSAIVAHQQANMAAFDKQSIRLTLTAYFVQAAVKALQVQPYVNSQWTDQGILLHRAAHIGIAVAIADGLIVPVLRNAQDLSLSGTARQVNDLAGRARIKQLRPDEVSGGTFTITNHGVSGSLFATPIINQPQAAILGIGAMQKRVVVLSDAHGDTMAIRPMMYATLTFDHRIIDGAIGDGFMSVFKKALENWA